MGHERTFGARWPVTDPCLFERDMKRGPIAGPDLSRDSRRQGNPSRAPLWPGASKGPDR
jgi:hypothetical protein